MTEPVARSAVIGEVHASRGSPNIGGAGAERSSSGNSAARPERGTPLTGAARPERGSPIAGADQVERGSSITSPDRRERGSSPTGSSWIERWPGCLLELGQVEYEAAWAVQRRLVAARRIDAIPDTLLLLEHPPTYTIGRSGTHASVLIDAAARQAMGIALIDVDRGGDATYHGPGQIVGYPIVDLRRRGNDVHAYLRGLEEILLRTLADHGLIGQRDGHYTGVWLGEAKVAAIGVKVSGGVTSHGFALNLDPDVRHWAGIVACGIRDRGVTSLARQLGVAPPASLVRTQIARHAGDVFGLAFGPPTADLARLVDLSATAARAVPPAPTGGVAMRPDTVRVDD